MSVFPTDTRLMLVHTTDPAEPPGGRAMLSQFNARLLSELYGDGFVDHRLPVRGGTARGILRGHVDGVDGASIVTLLTRIAAERISTVFLDGSNLGAAAASIRRVYPTVRIVTFFHNVEARFFQGALRERRSMRGLAVLVANFVAERQAVRASDVLIALSARDSAGLLRLYGRAADAVAPIVLNDTFVESATSADVKTPYALFVGGGFYANIAGIDWFARVIAPRIALPVMVVGRGMDVLAPCFATNDQVTLVGRVDNLAPWYAGAALVIAPIFDGSGMKTKVAEALMHGKRVVGTAEAFSGYAEDIVAANARCDSADAFVTALQAPPPPAFDPAMRALYERDHSPTAARARLARILGIVT